MQPIVIKKSAWYIPVLFISFSLSAQQPGPADTVSHARALAYQKNFEEAVDLLKRYNLNKNDVTALCLHAQVLYWMKKINEAGMIYEKAYSNFPDNPRLLREYGQFLFDRNKLYKSRRLLEAYRQTDSTHKETLSMLAYIELWTGHTGKARVIANQLSKLYPGSGEAADIFQKIEVYTAPALKLLVGIYSDDQSMQRYLVETEAAVYRSWLFSPFISASLSRFESDDKSFKTSWISGGNKFYLAPLKTSLEFSAGIFQASNFSPSNTWKIKLGQKISPAFTVDASAEKRPYQYTLASIRNPFLYNLSELGLNYDRNNRWIGRAAYQNQGFGDSNRVYTFYTWLMAPVVHREKFLLKSGYALSYADAESNTFQAAQPNAVPPVLNASVDGIYDPYFTPSAQTVHSFLAALEIWFSKEIRFSTNLNVGFAANASQPDLFVDREGTGPFFINKKFVDYRYNPVEWSAELKATLSRKLIAVAGYRYNSLIFFKSHFLNLYFNYRFLNEKGKK